MTQLSLYNLINGVFDCLGNLAGFQFHSNLLLHIEKFAFQGLGNVTFLELSDCPDLNFDDLYDIFSVSQNFPNLDHLILSGSGTSGSPLNLNDAFIDVLSTRPLEYIDVSYTNLLISFYNSSKMCTTLKYLILTGSRSHMTHMFPISKTCDSLRMLDQGKTITEFENMHCVNEHITCKMRQFFGAVEILFRNELITPSSNFVTSNCSLSLFPSSSITDFHFSQNYLPNFDILLINDRIKLLNLSKDSIADINPKAFEGMGALNKLDLSYNELSKVTDFENRFSKLFHTSSNLKFVHLNGNGLQYLPKATFVSNLNLEHLDLSNNSLTQVDFEISHLLDLKLLNLRLNNIESLDEKSRRSLDTLYASQIKTNKTDTVRVQLHDNPLSCQCTSLSFLEWLVNASMFSTTLHGYKCQQDGQHYLLYSGGVNAAKEDCERARRKRLKIILLSTLLPSGALIIFVTSLLLYKGYKKRLRRRRFADGIRHLRENADRFPVFLSYSSDDNDIVRRHMLQQMQDHLNQITGLDRELVCNADIHFYPAKTILSEIFHWIKQCEVLVAVMSENYCKSRYCRYEIEHAHLLGKPIILVFIENVPKKDMDLITREVFETFTRVQFVFEDGQPVLKPGWQPLCESIIELICQKSSRKAVVDEIL